VSFVLPAGQKVAIVGPSGCGKSTILRLLFRFYDSDSGSISIDGQNIKGVQLESLRKAIGVVPQETPLFHSDIMHNIRYGNLEATDDQVKEAARQARVYETVEKLPERWSAQVGERGWVVLRGWTSPPELRFQNDAQRRREAKTGGGPPAAQGLADPVFRRSSGCSWLGLN
jgi:ATP-binding cassette subfamily B (MDR/TAP) protein 7